MSGETPSRKRQRTAPDDDPLLLMDAYVSVQILQKKFQAVRSGMAPIVLQHQLYTLMHDSSMVDEEVERLRRGGKIRLFMVQTKGPSAAGILLTEQYLQIAEAAIRAACGGSGGAGEAARAVAFFRGAMNLYRQPSANRAELERHVEAAICGDFDSDSESGSDAEDDGAARAAAVEVVDLWQRAGLVLPRVDGVSGDMLRFCFPELGPFGSDLDEGQKELAMVLRMRRYKEMGMRELEKRGLRRSAVPMYVVVDRMVARGAAKRIETQAGTLVKLCGK